MPDRLTHLRGRQVAGVVVRGRDRPERFGVVWPRRLGHELIPIRTHTRPGSRPVPARERRSHPGQELIVRVRVPESFRELGEHLVRCGTFAVDHPVREPLRSGPQRLERDRDDRRGGGRQDRLPLAAHERADPDHDPDVHRRDDDGDRSVQQRAIDHDVDIEQVVAEHRYPDRDRDQAE